MGFALHPMTFYENLNPKQISFECDFTSFISNYIYLNLFVVIIP
jgi:hypothetical protein